MSENRFYAILGLGILGVLLLIFACIITLVLYVLNAYPLYMILKEVGYDLAWLAWVPFCQYFAITMAFNYRDEPNINLFGIQIPRPVAGFATLIGSILARIVPFIGGAFPILAVLICGGILGEMFDVCENKEPGSNLGMGILSSLIIFTFLKKKSYSIFLCSIGSSVRPTR